MEYSEKMYLLKDIGEMQRRAYNESLGKGVSPVPRMVELLASDLRFKDYNHSALANAADSWWRSGPRPDLDDPALKGKPTWKTLRRI